MAATVVPDDDGSRPARPRHRVPSGSARSAGPTGSAGSTGSADSTGSAGPIGSAGPTGSADPTRAGSTRAAGSARAAGERTDVTAHRASARAGRSEADRATGFSGRATTRPARATVRATPSAGRTARGVDLPAHDPDLDSYLAALAPEAEGPLETTGRFGTAQVFQLRLPPLRVEQLRRVAEERGVTPGSLALDWVIERLDREDMPTGPLQRIHDEERARRSRFRRRKP